MLREKGKLGIRNILRDRDNSLWEKLEKIWSKSYVELEEPELALSHSIAVEQNVSLLIPDQWKLEKFYPLELFALSAASCLHDIDKGLGTFKKLHGEVSAGEIRIHFSKYGLDAGEADIIGWIIKVHDHGDFSFDLPEDPIVIGALELNIKPLAALFRLADILHADYRRIDSAKAINPKDRARYCIRG
jgi:hypothetical protein